MDIIDTLTNREGEEFLFVRCREESVHKLALLEIECFPRDFWSEISFLEALTVPACAIFAAYNKAMTEIAAYGVIYTASDEGDLANIAVSPKYRRQGLGKALLTKICGEARALGVERLFLEVRESNGGAMALYSSVGFTQIGRRRNYYVNPREDAVTMVKALKTQP